MVKNLDRSKVFALNGQSTVVIVVDVKPAK